MSKYRNILKITKVLNKIASTKIIFHRSLINESLQAGENIFDKFSSSEEGENMMRIHTECKPAIVSHLLSRQTDEDLSGGNWTRKELFTIEPKDLVEEYITRPDRFGNYAIVTAASNGDFKMLEMLYKIGGELYVRNDNGDGVINDSWSSKITSILNYVVTELFNESWESIIKNPGNDKFLSKISECNTDEALRDIIVDIKIKPNNLSLVNKLGENALHIASKSGNITMVKALVGMGAEINAVDKYNATALLRACARGYKEIVSYLIDCAADLKIPYHNAGTPLYIAAAYKQTEVLEVLLQSPDVLATIDQADQNGNTPLKMACHSPGSVEAVQLLINHGANLNIANRPGFTPLMVAAQSGDKSIVELLIDAGANMTQQSRFGETAEEGALRNGFPEVHALIQSKRFNLIQNTM